MAELGEIIDTNLNDGQDAVNNVVPEVQLHANIEPQPPLGVLANDPIAEMSDMDAKAIANFIVHLHLLFIFGITFVELSNSSN